MVPLERRISLGRNAENASWKSDKYEELFTLILLLQNCVSHDKAALLELIKMIEDSSDVSDGNAVCKITEYVPSLLSHLDGASKVINSPEFYSRVTRLLNDLAETNLPDETKRSLKLPFAIFIDEVIRQDLKIRQVIEEGTEEPWFKFQSEVPGVGTNGGRVFYSSLEELYHRGERLVGVLHEEILKIYYLCLKLGYKGEGTNETIRRWIDLIRTRITPGDWKNIIKDRRLSLKPSTKFRVFYRAPWWSIPASITSMACIAVIFLIVRDLILGKI